MPSPLADLLRDLSAAFERLGVRRWYLFGAQAAIVHGAARLTADVDATVDAGDLEPATLGSALERGGFVPRVTDLAGFAQRTRVLPFVHGATGMPVDVVLAGPGLEEDFLRRAQVRDVGGVRVPVATAEDVIAMKVLAGRPKDLDDVVAVLEVQGDALDVARIRDLLDQLEAALDRADMLPAFEAALNRARPA